MGDTRGRDQVVSKCLGCGATCLAYNPPVTCNNCDPVISRMIADAAEAIVTELSEEEVIHEHDGRQNQLRP